MDTYMYISQQRKTKLLSLWCSDKQGNSNASLPQNVHHNTMKETRKTAYVTVNITTSNINAAEISAFERYGSWAVTKQVR